MNENYDYLAELLFKEIDKTPDYYENLYPQRDLPQDAKVTRIAPSPTGFMHLGNLFGAITDERLAHLSGGVFYLRIEDTDQKREVEGGVETILKVFSQFNLNFDEGATLSGDNGAYGPYRQRQRELIYKCYAKELVRRGLAYPCFCTEQELSDMREVQQQNKENFGYYGSYAVHRDLKIDEIEKAIGEGKPYVIRFKSMGNTENKVRHTDLIKGDVSMPENDMDIVLLKADGIPTYHFAHVIDDHLMRTTHVVRGEEWLATLPIHLQLFDTLGFKRPKYAHTAQLMKMDGNSKRKLSKRKDPELALDYYNEKGYPVSSVVEYLMTLLNSNFEEWRIANPTKDVKEFNFTTKKMSGSGCLFDINKLDDVSRNTISVMTAEQVYDYVTEWAKAYDQQLYSLITADPSYTKAILSIGRGGKKPRKDITYWSGVGDYLSFFFDDLFKTEYDYPSNVAKDDVIAILEGYKTVYDDQKEQNDWFNDICELSKERGFSQSTKEYKQNPEQYKGHPGDVSMVLRVAVTGRQNSPDMYDVMKTMGKAMVVKRLELALEAAKA